MITLTPWKYKDIPQLENLYRNTDQRFCLVAVPVPLPFEQTRQYARAIRDQLNDGKPFLCMAVKQDDAIIGKAELTKHSETEAELDIVIMESYTRKGYGTEALQSLIRYAREKEWCASIAAYVRTDNEAAVKLLEKNGFQKGRRFKADILKPLDGQYILHTADGMEYTLDL